MTAKGFEPRRKASNSEILRVKATWCMYKSYNIQRSMRTKDVGDV